MEHVQTRVDEQLGEDAESTVGEHRLQDAESRSWSQHAVDLVDDAFQRVDVRANDSDAVDGEQSVAEAEECQRKSRGCGRGNAVNEFGVGKAFGSDGVIGQRHGRRLVEMKKIGLLFLFFFFLIEPRFQVCV